MPPGNEIIDEGSFSFEKIVSEQGMIDFNVTIQSLMEWMNQVEITSARARIIERATSRQYVYPD